METFKRLNISISRKILVTHIIGILFPLVSGYQILINEFQNEKFIFYFYNQPLSEAPSNEILIIPLSFFIITFCFAILFSLIKIEKNLKSIFRKVFSASFLLYIYFLFLTLQEETNDGAFYWPIDLVEFPYKIVYVKWVISLFFLGYYFLSIKSHFDKNQYLGKFNSILLYSPIASLIFSNFWPTHLLLWLYAGCIFIFLKNSNLNLNFVNTISDKNKIIVFLVSIFIIAFVFRIWTLSYFKLFGVINIPGLAADGPHSYKAAWSFATGEPFFSVVPYSYSLLLFLLLKIVGFSLTKTLILQSFITCITPLLIFYVCNQVFNQRVAIIATICSALSYELLHFSVITHRTGFASFFLVIYLSLLLKSLKNLKLSYGFILGVFLGWTILLEGLLAPIAALILIPIIGSTERKKAGLFIVLSILGILIAEISFNIPIYNIYKTVFPLGRSLETGHVASWYLNWIHGNHEASKYINKIGFNPFDFPTNSLKMAMEDPIGISFLLIKKFIFEVRAYFLGHNSFFLDPFLLNENSFFSSALIFFYFPVLTIGFFGFIFTKSINWRHKTILAVPFLYHLLFHTVVVFAYARYRGIVLPLLIIYFSYGIYLSASFLLQKNANELNKKPISKIPETNRKLTNISLKRNYFYRTGLFTLLLAGALVFNNQITQHQNATIDKNKPIIKKVSNRFLWKDQNGKISNLLLSSPNRELKYRFQIFKTDVYDIHVKIAKEFGPSLWTQELEFYMDNILLRKHELQSIPGWLELKNIPMKESGHTLSIRAVKIKKSLSSFTFGKFPRYREIKLMDLVINPS
jgi:hypothetical protein